MALGRQCGSSPLICAHPPRWLSQPQHLQARASAIPFEWCDRGYKPNVAPLSANCVRIGGFPPVAQFLRAQNEAQEVTPRLQGVLF